MILEGEGCIAGETEWIFMLIVSPPLPHGFFRRTSFIRLFFFLTSLLEYKLLYNGVLVSAVSQSESTIRIHISPYPLPLASCSRPTNPTPLGGHKAPS